MVIPTQFQYIREQEPIKKQLLNAAYETVTSPNYTAGVGAAGKTAKITTPQAIYHRAKLPSLEG